YFAPGELQATVARGGGTVIGLRHVANSAIELGGNFFCSVGGTVVDDDDLHRCTSGIKNAMNRVAEIFLAVVNGNNDAKERSECRSHLVPGQQVKNDLRNFVLILSKFHEVAGQPVYE